MTDEVSDENDDSDEVEAEETVVIDPLQIMQNALHDIMGPGSLAVNFAVVAEWLEEDGSTAMSVFHSPMTPWLLEGLLTYARDSERTPLVSVRFDDEDDDDFYE